VEADDGPFGVPGDADICADIWFVDGLPRKVQPLRGAGASSSSVLFRYIFDFKMNDQVMVSRWQLHYGEILGLPMAGGLISLTTATPRVNTDTPMGMTTANVDFTLNHAHIISPETAAIGFGDLPATALPIPLPAAVSHSYTLMPWQKSQTFKATASMTNLLGDYLFQTSVTVLRQPEVSLRVDGKAVFDGATIEVEADRLLQLSLADSLGYIERESLSISGRLNKTGTTGLIYSGVLFGESDIGQTYPLTVSVSNTGAGLNSDSMTVSLLVVPEPGTLGLLGLAACCLLRKLRPAG
jgi:hypothetical protein